MESVKHRLIIASLSSLALSAILVIAAPAAATATLQSPSATSTSVTLTWTAPGDDGTSGTASEYDIRYSTAPITSQNFLSANKVLDAPAPKPAGSAESFEVTGLTSSTTYYFAIKTADEMSNWSEISNVAEGTTAADQTPPAAIDDLQASTGKQEGDIELTWTASGDDNHFGVAAFYEIRYSQEPFDVNKWLDQSLYLSSPTPAAAGNTETHVMTSLIPGQTYWIGIRVFDEAGNSSPPSSLAFAEAYLELTSDTGDENNALVPDNFVLAQNYPNPFNPSTVIEYSLPEQTQVSVDIFNVRGQRIDRLVNATHEPGVYSVEWNGTASDGSPVSSGIYFCRITARDFTATRKMALVK
jgi:methionine-rich copper-binding protein CopC